MASIYVSDRGIMNGTSATSSLFSPNDYASRGEVVLVLYRLSGDAGIYTQANQFSDVPSTMYCYDAVGWAVYHGITTGTPDGLFKPDDIVTWEQFFTFLYRYAQYKDLPLQATESLIYAPDYGNVGSYARTPLSWSYTYGIQLRSSLYANLYPKANLERQKLALSVARFCRNVEGLVWNRDRFLFINSETNMVSGGTEISDDTYINRRKMISDEDWSRLTQLAEASPNSTSVMNKLNSVRATWNGSCYGFSAIITLHNLGKINVSGNCANLCNTLYDIPKPRTLSSTKHRLTSDTLYYPPTMITISDVESKINLYQLSTCIPALKTFTSGFLPSEELSNVLLEQENSGIGVLTYTSSSIENAHAVILYGKPIEITSGYKIMAYDPRYSSRECWLEIKHTPYSGTLAITTSGGMRYEPILTCKFSKDFGIYDSLLDFDGFDNSNSITNRTSANSNYTVSENIFNLSKMLSTTHVDGKPVSLIGKTILYIDSAHSFEVKNNEGNHFIFENGQISGSMNVYGVDMTPNGTDYPGTYAFLVDDSEMFTCSSIDNTSEILSFSVVGGDASGCVQVENLDQPGWKMISIDTTGTVSTKR